VKRVASLGPEPQNLAVSNLNTGLWAARMVPAMKLKQNFYFGFI